MGSPHRRIVLALLLAALALPLAAQPEPIDWSRARSIHEKAQRGETLTLAEQNIMNAPKPPAGPDSSPGKARPRRRLRGPDTCSR